MTENGKLTGLVSVQGVALESDTARDWSRMVAAAKADGVDLWITAHGGYEDIAAQVVRKRAGSASGIRVAEPGTQTHGWGDRIDVGSFGPVYGKAGAARAKWLHDHAREYGFDFEFGSRDPNHLRHKQTTPPPETRKKPTMPINFVNTSTYDGAGNASPTSTLYATAGEGGAGSPANWIESTRATPAKNAIVVALSEKHGPHIPLDSAEWASMKAMFLAPVSVSGAMGAGLTLEQLRGEYPTIAAAVNDNQAERLKS